MSHTYIQDPGQTNSQVLQHTALQLEMVQCWVTKLVKNDYIQQSSVAQMLTNHQWWTLTLRQNYEQLSLMY